MTPATTCGLETAFDGMVDALERAAADARAAESAMRRFLADASHELRTPVAAVQASAETLLREQPRRPARDALEARLAGDAARLGQLVDDLLGLARLEGSEEPRADDVELDAVLVAAVDDARARAGYVDVAACTSGLVHVSGDADAIGRALRNLLDNAVAAARPSGHVTVELATADGTARVRVRDDGPGVPAADRERIFDRFVQLDGSRSGSGAGLGLAIARRTARQHGGDLTCDAVAAGASFTLVVPLARTAEVESAPGPAVDVGPRR